MDAETRCCGGVLEESLGISLVERWGSRHILETPTGAIPIRRVMLG
jgi:hypothetical protein